MIDNLPKSRKEAISIGSEYYYSGPCKRGHEAPRLTRKAECVECKKENDKRLHILNREKRINKAVEWNRNNKERRKEICATYYENHKNELSADRKERFSDWYYGNHEENKKRRRVSQQNRNAKKRHNGGSFTKQDVSDIMKMQNGKCAVCGVKIGDAWHIDHIIPINKGGHNNRSNLQILCIPCNISKKDQDPIDFMRKRGRLL